MKKFYELLDTRFPLRATVVLKPITEMPPMINLKINGRQVYEGHPKTETKIEHEIFNNENVRIELMISDKKYTDNRDSAVLLDSLVIDGVEMSTHASLNAVYQTDQAWGVYKGVTTHFGWNGTWIFDPGKPFYHVKHEIKNYGWLLSPAN